MLNNGVIINIYDNEKLIFRHDKLHNDNITPNKFTITALIMHRTMSKNKYVTSDVN